MKKLRFGMIGGGRGAFIGAVHRIAAALDGEAELAAGAFSSDPERSRASGRDLGLDESRVYGSYREMARAEASRPPDERLDFVSIVTPNFEHFAPAALFLRSGFHVVCDKPVCCSLAEALRLREIVRRSDRLFVLTHNYAGNPLVRQARDLVRAGRLGRLRKIVVEYPQGWLAGEVRNKQAEWRMDPKRSGPAGCLGDVGTHAEHLARYVTGLRIESLCADLSTFGAGRVLDDDANILVRWEGGVKGVLHCSQISLGEENALNLRVYGTRAALEWHQQRPNELIVRHGDRPEEIWRRGQAYLGERAKAATRLPPGHPEGYLEAFANLYREAFRAMRARAAGRPVPKDADFPTIDDGVEGMAFLETAVRSSRAGSRWRRMPRR